MAGHTSNEPQVLSQPYLLSQSRQLVVLQKHEVGLPEHALEAGQGERQHCGREVPIGHTQQREGTEEQRAVAGGLAAGDDISSLRKDGHEGACAGTHCPDLVSKSENSRSVHKWRPLLTCVPKKFCLQQSIDN